MKTKKENSKNLPKNDDGTDLRRLPLLHHATVITLFFAIMAITKDIIIKHHCHPRQFNLDIKEGNSVQEF